MARSDGKAPHARHGGQPTMYRPKISIPLAVVAAVGLISAANATVTGAGSTFIYPVLSKWTA
ncbi:MAG: hypothetical protein ACXWI5_06935, partial [Croceibacterium sp.]